MCNMICIKNSDVSNDAGNYVGNYMRNEVRKHDVRYVGTDMTPEIGIGNDVISSVVSYVFLCVVFHVLSYIVPYIVFKTFFLHLLI